MICPEKMGAVSIAFSLFISFEEEDEEGSVIFPLGSPLGSPGW
jgi:hypothetical protein